MTSPHPLPQPATRPVRLRPFGGAVEIAQSYLAAHTRNPWTGRCRSCGDRFPCQHRQEALAATGAAEAKPPLAGKHLAWLAVPVLIGVAIIAASVARLVQ